MAVKIVVSGPAAAMDSNDEPVTDQARLTELDGAESSESFLEHLEDSLRDLGLQGGRILLRWIETNRSLRVESHFHCYRSLTESELGALRAQTSGQWSDGLGEGCFDHLPVQVDLLPSVSENAVSIEQLDDGVKIKAPKIPPLVSAVKKGDLGRVKRELAKGARVNARSNAGVTALLLAVQRQEEAIALALIEAGADPDIAGPDEERSLHAAARWGSSTVTKALIAGGAAPDVRDDRGATPLMWAANRGHGDVLEALLDSGADPNAQDWLEYNAGCTTLMYLSPDRIDLGEKLVAAGADVGLKNDAGHDAVAYHRDQLESLKGSPHTRPEAIEELEGLVSFLENVVRPTDC